MDKKEYKKKWKQENKEKVRQHWRNYRAKNKDKLNQYKKEYLLKNPEKRKIWQKRSTEKHKQQWMKILPTIFLEVACYICGYNKCFQALDFHHQDPNSKQYSISDMFRWAVTEERINELKSCVILCCRCHREVHAGALNENLQSK